YYRIKILTDEGKKYADVKVAYDNAYSHVTDIKGRTIHSDGTVILFEGKALDGTMFKTKRLKILAKTFTLPDVQVGSIIEYKYTVRTDPGWAFPARWSVQEDMFQKRAKFSFAPFKHEVLVGGLNGSEVGYTTYLPQGSKIVKKYDHFDLEVSDVPAFVEEEYSPPADDLKYRVRFYYERGDIRTVGDFWRYESRDWSDSVSKFMSRSSYIEDQARQGFAPSDSPEQKLRKIYARVQQIDNLTYKRQRSTQEQKATNYRDNKNVEDVLRQNAGYHNDLTRLFVAMARAAGVDAKVARVSTRDENFFSDQLLDFGQLNSEVALVKLDGKDVYLDPGTRFCPFGLLEWRRSGVKGLVESKGDAQFITTSFPELKNAMVQRVAAFNLAQDGSLKGKVRLVFTGQEALWRRLEENDDDDTGRTKNLEDELRQILPASATIHLDDAKGWTSTEEPLDAVFSVEVPGYASSTGKRLLLTTEIFQANSKQAFVHEKRTNPVYFEYPHRTFDMVTINVPPSLQIEDLPKEHKVIEDFAGYLSHYESQGQKVVLRRQLDVAGMMFPVNTYPRVKTFYEQVKSSDDEAAVLRVAQVAKN
ncbi:MAG: DUF3857 and transglutaminase domain-containing protein, partial [Acidobacteria bacterium]|nr:DUF3857 and transglutaminase domain-containing protein [Acidobacteriota bacterium]